MAKNIKRKRKCKRRRPCDRIQKEWEVDILCLSKDKPPLIHERRLECMREEKAHRELIGKQVQDVYKQSIARYQQSKAQAAHIGARPGPRVHYEHLIDLNDLPTKTKVLNTEKAINQFQTKNLFYLQPRLKKYRAALKTLESQQITTDFEVASLVKHCQQTKLQERIRNAIGKRGLFESQAICAERQTHELRRTLAREEKLYANLSKAMEKKNQELSALVVENRCLLATTDKKMRMIIQMEEDFRLDRETLQEQLRCVKQDVKYLPKSELYAARRKKKHTKSAKKKVTSHPCPNHPRDNIQKLPKTELRFVNDINLVQSRRKEESQSEGVSSSVPTLQTSFRHFTECMQLRDHMQDLKLRTIKKRGHTKQKLQVKREQLETYAPSHVREYLSILKKSLATKARKHRRMLHHRTILLRQGKKALKVAKPKFAKDSKYISRSYKYAEKAIQRLVALVLTAGERAYIAKLYRETECLRRRQIYSQDIQEKKDDDGVKANMMVDSETIPTFLRHLDEKLLRWLDMMTA